MLDLLKSLLPTPLRRTLRAWKQRFLALFKSRRRIFSDIYKHGVWGTGDGGFFSGDGSLPENTKAYEDVVIRLIEDQGVASILDIGCGDFSVAERILSKQGAKVRYLGVDIVPELVEHLRREHGGENIQFDLLDAVTDPLPKADLVIVKEVLQHLPNKDVRRVTEKLLAFPYALVTNTQARNPISFNEDLPAGPETRVQRGSGLWLDKAPFHFPFKEVLRVDHAYRSSVIVTLLHVSK